MSESIIEVENLGKKFIIAHHQQQRYLTLRDIIANNAKATFQKAAGIFNGQLTNGTVKEEFWACKDISFAINRGDRVGIVGRNGAGKSTLLKLLSRISEPTAGRITIRGRVASLLEVGTGFHPELSGRENIFLNGAILGMPRREIRKKFDEIVAFAEVEKFLDTPVKRYSSGMYVRLAFAVAAHLEPEVLIVDEVLAVGDQQFQKKCLGKMEDVSKNEGRTVLFVSHNMSAIRKLCRTGILLNKGRMVAQGSIDTIANLYIKEGAIKTEEGNFESYPGRTGTGRMLFKSAKLLDGAGQSASEFFIGDKMQLEFVIANQELIKASAISIQIKGLDDLPLLHIVNTDAGFALDHRSREERFRIAIDEISLFPGEYRVTLAIADPSGHVVYDNLEACLGFSIMEGGALVNRRLPREVGLFFVKSHWEKLA